MESHQLVNQDSGDTEKYTPNYIIKAARQTMEGIDLDPASSIIANKTIKATTIFTKDDDGLSKVWRGRVWMNHPFSRGEKACCANCKKKTCISRGYHIKNDTTSNADWINKLVDSYENGLVTQAVCICFASTSEGWFKPLHLYPQCYFNGRVHYVLPNGEIQNGATKGSVVTYLGPNLSEFHKAFSPYGFVKIPYVLSAI